MFLPLNSCVIPSVNPLAHGDGLRFWCRTLRDIALSLFLFGSLPVILLRPYIGVLLWTWIGVMNPHRLTWGFAYDFPFAFTVGIATLLGVALTGAWRRLPITREIVLLAIFVFWMFVTTVFALNPSGAWIEWNQLWKIQLMVVVSIMLLRKSEQIRAFVWVIAISLGFYGAKGGLFTLFGGGEDRVWGPPGSFIEGNNEIGLALTMAMPLLRYLQLSASSWWVRAGTLGVMLLCGIAILGTHSRGAFLGIGVMLLFLAMKSRRRIPLLVLMAFAIPAGLAFMPQQWTDRMASIQNYREDGSALGRINAWTFAWNLASVRPVVGGGFRTFTPALMAIYAPDPDAAHDAHSIYFEVLAEHGFPGLFMFLGLLFVTWRSCSWVIGQSRRARDDPDLMDAGDLARMVQVALVGYAVSGAFLGLAYFDLYYNLVALAVLNRLRVLDRLADAEREAEVDEEGDELEMGAVRNAPSLAGVGRL